MRTTRLILLVLVPIIAFSACVVAIGAGGHSSWGFMGRRGSGVSTTQTRLLGEFHALRIEGSCDANVTVGGTQSIEVTADDNLVDDITTVISEGVLVIAMKDGANDWFRVGPKVAISVPAFDAASIEGSGDVDVKGVGGESFTAQISGSGDLKAQGHVTTLKASIDGSGDMDLSKLESQDASVSIDGSGDVRVRFSASLAASVSGSGDIYYQGPPAKTKISVSGSGEVRPVH